MARTIGAVVVVTAATALLQPGPSWSAVRISHDRVVVTAQAAHAVIHRTPFTLRIENRSGRPVLREVAGGSAPLSVGPVADPVAPGFDSPSVPTLYAPLHFLVGSESSGLALFRNVGTAKAPKFERDSTFVAPVPTMSAPVAADFKGDGHLELLVGNVGGGAVYLEQQQ